MNFQTLIRDTVKEQILAIAANKGIEPNFPKIIKNFARTQQAKFKEIFEAVQNEGKEADILGGLEHKRIDPLVKKSAGITFIHECLKYAHELMEIELETK
jgi:hypothetical protein